MTFADPINIGSEFNRRLKQLEEALKGVNMASKNGEKDEYREKYETERMRGVFRRNPWFNYAATNLLISYGTRDRTSDHGVAANIYQNGIGANQNEPFEHHTCVGR